MLRWMLVFGLGFLGCGHGAQGPFGAMPGADRVETASALKKRGFCAPRDLIGERLVFPRCPEPGLDLYIARVEVIFDGDRLRTARRVEVHADDSQAQRRWHDLVTERTADGRQRASAGDQLLRTSGVLPDGAVSWVVWRHGGVVHGVILVRPPGRESLEVVEVLTAPPPST